MPLTLACAFATSDQSHEHARIAEDLGYERAWFYDSPALYPTSGYSSVARPSVRRRSASDRECWCRIFVTR